MSEGLVALLVGVVICAVLFGGIFLEDRIVTSWEAAYDSARATCAELGYQKHSEYRGAFFCVTYGLEPRIMRLGTEAELAGK